MIWEWDINRKIRFGVALLFVATGIWVMIGNVMPDYINDRYHYVMGFILIFYGIFRFVHYDYRKNIKRADETLEENEE